MNHFSRREFLSKTATLAACIFRSKAASDSGSIRPPVLVQSGHRFRLNPATFWTGPECEATLDNDSEMGQDISFKRRHKWPERGYPCNVPTRVMCP